MEITDKQIIGHQFPMFLPPDLKLVSAGTRDLLAHFCHEGGPPSLPSEDLDPISSLLLKSFTLWMTPYFLRNFLSVSSELLSLKFDQVVIFSILKFFNSPFYPGETSQKDCLHAFTSYPSLPSHGFNLTMLKPLTCKGCN